MDRGRYKHWGWGYESTTPDRKEMQAAAEGVHQMFGFGGEPEEPVPFEALEVPRSRLSPPATLEEAFTVDPYERVVRSLGKAYRDVVRGFRGRFPTPPDLVARPTRAEDVERILTWAADQNVAVIPFGGGTSVVGGVEARARGYAGTVCLDLRSMSRVLEIDEVSQSARIEAGATGPRLEDQLRKHDLTLRFFPQSFEFSTLGGWIATRAGGHFATGPTHIEDLLESVRAVTPRGIWESRRLPGSGAGPSPDRLLAGSEGALGVITDAWVRVQPRPRFKAAATIRFGDFLTGAQAVRELSQSGLSLANCRLLDPVEAMTTGVDDGSAAVLLLGAESPLLPVDRTITSAVEIATGAGGQAQGEIQVQGESQTDTRAATWRTAFLFAPYFRDTLVACGVLSETFETAITWDRLEEFHARVSETATKAVAEVCTNDGSGPAKPRISCRFTHVYPDGPALYFTVIAPALRGGEVEQWDEIKAAVSEAIIDAGGTITHHHAVGRDHRPAYDRQRPEPFAAALRAAKHELDPAGILNPGVLVDP